MACKHTIKLGGLLLGMGRRGCDLLRILEFKPMSSASVVFRSRNYLFKLLTSEEANVVNSLVVTQSVIPTNHKILKTLENNFY